LICMAYVLVGGTIDWSVRWMDMIPIPVLPVASPMLMLFLFNLMFVNIVWGMFNLLPVYPLDGGHITRELFSLVHARRGIEWSMLVSVIVASGLAGYSLYQLGKTARGSMSQMGINGLLGSQNFFMLLLFGVLAYQNYQMYLAYTGRRR